MANILVIDDYPDTLDVLQRILKINGHNVKSATNGRDGLKIALDTKPDLIICDIMMPFMNGYEVLKALRKDPNTFSVPFILLTSKNEKNDIRAGMELGADDYITKPFSRSEILKAVDTRLEKSKSLQQYYVGKLKEIQQYLLSSLPHELRTPLNSILGFARLIEQNLDILDKENIRAMLENIIESGQDLLRMVGNYSYYSKLKELLIENDEEGTEFDTDTKTIIEETAFDNSYLHDRAGDLVLETIDYTLGMKEEHLRKLLKELIDNAFKFSFKNTKIFVQSYLEKKVFTIKISNNGVGMTDEEIENISPFAQFNREIHEQQGSGLGLVISKAIAEIYNTGFSIKSKPGKDLSVILTFPSS